MYRNSPSRNQRSKGVKVKHILQICLLVAVSLWLLYQVKHSHDKKKEFDETDAKTSLHGENSDDIIKLGRKDIRPLKEEPVNKNEKRDETLEEEEEIEENKNEEGGPEDKKVLEKEEEEIDEPEQEKSDTEEDLVDDEKEREESDENDTEEKDSESEEGNNSQVEKESEREGVDKDTHEARDENYKADDASSAVTHETQTVTHENTSGQENKANNSVEFSKGENKADLNVTSIGTKENASYSNKTEAQESEHLLETRNNSTEVATENKEQNVTQSKLELNSNLNNSTLEVNNAHVVYNSTALPEIKDAEANPEEFSNSSNKTANSQEFSNSSNKTESFASEELKSEVEGNDTLNGDKSESDDGKDEEILESEMNENPEEVQHDSIDVSDSSNTLEMKDVRTDLDTLPEIQTEGTNSEDVAAE